MMAEVGNVRFHWRENLALAYAYIRDEAGQVEPLLAGKLTLLAACHRAGGAEAFLQLPTRARAKLFHQEAKAMRGALAHLGDLGLVAWDYTEGTDALVYRLTEPGARVAARLRQEPQVNLH